MGASGLSLKLSSGRERAGGGGSVRERPLRGRGRVQQVGPPGVGAAREVRAACSPTVRKVIEVKDPQLFIFVILVVCEPFR